MACPLRCISIAVVCTAAACANAQWSTQLVAGNTQLNINYSGSQYAVIDLPSGYMRFVYGPQSGWGTSIDVMPSFWTGGKLYQGYPVTASGSQSGANFRLIIDGQAQGLSSEIVVTIQPPAGNAIRAQVAATTLGSVALDTNRPGEAFKPVFLSSMHESSSLWDASAAFVGNRARLIPLSGWLIGPSPVVSSQVFGLLGGTSTWKHNAPSVTIAFPSAMQIAGWITQSANPNDDNVGFWAASNTVLASWSYAISVDTKALPPAARPDAGSAPGGFQSR